MLRFIALAACARGRRLCTLSSTHTKPQKETVADAPRQTGHRTVNIYTLFEAYDGSDDPKAGGSALRDTRRAGTGGSALRDEPEQAARLFGDRSGSRVIIDAIYAGIAVR